jgi:hypothetical protein
MPLDCYGAFTSGGFNLIGAINGSTGWGALGDQVGDTNSYLNPLLGPWQYNGGPTMTCAPQVGSPAIDQGSSSGIFTDQRGRARPFTNSYVASIPLGSDRSDIGAYEVSPITLVVSNNNDSGSGSLRQMILEAAPYDAITFATNVVATIALTNGELLVDKTLAIVGPTNSRLVISGNNASRGLHLTGGTASISGLTIANGNASNSDGGGLLSDTGSTLILNNCTLSGNTAGTGGGNVGGGLANQGTMLATNCTFSGNHAPSGGGLYNFATAFLQNCTVSSNSAASGGGYDHAVLNSTNSVGSTIIAGNSASSSGPDLFYGFTSRGYNLIGKIDAGSGFTNGVNHDQVGSSAAPLNPLLGPLQDNGGPTFTHALQPGSPAIDKGVRNGLLTDQRGALRPFDFAAITNASGGDGSDIGAFELGSPSLNIQTVGTDIVLSWPWYYGGFTLQSTTNPVASNTWTSAAGGPVVVAGQFQQTNNMSSGNQFFRLKSN